jgi:WD40 repeat protein
MDCMLSPPKLANDDPRAFDKKLMQTAMADRVAWSPKARALVLVCNGGLLRVDADGVRWEAGATAIGFRESTRWPRAGRAFAGRTATAPRGEKQIAIRSTAGKLLKTFDRVGDVDCLTFTPDEQGVIAANHAHVCRRWDWATGKAGPAFAGHGDFVTDMAFADEKHLLTACMDGGLRVWDGTTGACLGLILVAHDGAGWLAALPDGTIDASPGLRGLRYGYRENAPPGHRAFQLLVKKRTPEVALKILGLL